MFGCQPHLHGGVVGGKETGQHQADVARGQFPPVGRTFFGRQLAAVGQRHGNAVGVHEQAVFGQEAGKQHAVPLLIGNLVDQGVHAVGLAALAQLAGAGAQSAAQAALGLGHGREGFVAAHGQRRQRGGGRLRQRARGDHGAFKLAAQVGGEGWHGDETFRCVIYWRCR